jgi:hypothetical protein
MKRQFPAISVLTAALLSSALLVGCRRAETRTDAALSGAWRGSVLGTSGWLADMKGLEFMYAFNADGTMTESSNYDAFPPGPPAYGVWRRTGARQFDARYEVFLTKAIGIMDEIAKGNGWRPNGRGVLSQTLTLSADGNAFESTIRFDLFDPEGKPVEGGGQATSHAERIRF